MFKTLFLFYTTNLYTPSVLFKLNIWAFQNIRIFKIKLINQIIFFIESLYFLKNKFIKIQYKDFSFSYFYFFFLNIYIFIIIAHIFFF